MKMARDEFADHIEMFAKAIVARFYNSFQYHQQLQKTDKFET